MTSGAPLVDAHQLGLGATGNETWAAGVAGALEVDGGVAPTYAVTGAGRALLPSTVGDDRILPVASSSARRLALDLPRAIRRARPTAVVAQYTLPRVRTPGVVAIHDLSFEDPASAAWIPAPTRLRYRTTIRASARRAAAVLALTEYGRQDLLSRYGLDPDRVLVAPPGVDAALLAALQITPRAAEPDPVVLCVGTVLPRKNLPAVAGAVAELRRAGVPARLRLVGPERPAGAEDLAAVRRLLPGAAREEWGAVDTARLAEAYATSSVLAFPSLHEGFGLPIVEAMSAGLPVVASTATCLPEVVGDAGVLVDPHDVGAWAHELGTLLTDAGAREGARLAGHQRVVRFSWSATAAAVRRGIALASA